MQAKQFSMFIAVVAILVTLLFSLTASARVGFGHGGSLLGGRLSAALELSDNQKAQIQSLWASHREATRPVYEQLQEKRKALAEFTRAHYFDEAQVQALAQELANLQAEIAVHNARLTHEALSVLSPEQKAKLNELQEERRQRFKEWRERHLRKPDHQG